MVDTFYVVMTVILFFSSAGFIIYAIAENKFLYVSLGVLIWIGGYTLIEKHNKYVELYKEFQECKGKQHE